MRKIERLAGGHIRRHARPHLLDRGVVHQQHDDRGLLAGLFDVEQRLARPQRLPLRIVDLAAQARGLGVLAEAETDHGVEIALERDEAVQHLDPQTRATDRRKPRGKPGWDGKPREKKFFRKD